MAVERCEGCTLVPKGKCFTLTKIFELIHLPPEDAPSLPTTNTNTALSTKVDHPIAFEQECFPLGDRIRRNTPLCKSRGPMDDLRDSDREEEVARKSTIRIDVSPDGQMISAKVLDLDSQILNWLGDNIWH